MEFILNCTNKAKESLRQNEFDRTIQQLKECIKSSEDIASRRIYMHIHRQLILIESIWSRIKEQENIGTLLRSETEQNTIHLTRRILSFISSLERIHQKFNTTYDDIIDCIRNNNLQEALDIIDSTALYQDTIILHRQYSELETNSENEEIKSTRRNKIAEEVLRLAERLRVDNTLLFKLPNFVDELNYQQIVHRIKDWDTIKENILNYVPKKEIIFNSNISGIYGMGGVGKTTTSIFLAWDYDILEKFSDGVFWFGLGTDPKILDHLNRIAKHYNENHRGFKDERDGTDKLRKELYAKKILIILDNVWSEEHINRFKLLGPNGHLFITSRDQRVQRYYDPQSLKILSEILSFEILAKAAGITVDRLKKEEQDILKIIERSGNLPLTLAIIGSMAYGQTQPPWKSYLDWLEKSKLKKFVNIENQYEYETPYHAIDMSVEYLPQKDKEKFTELALFHRGASIPESFLLKFWEEDDFDIGDIKNLLQRFVDRSLLMRKGKAHYIFHDLIYDYLQLKSQDYGLNHEKLIDTYFRLSNETWKLDPNDDYYFEYIIYHLAEHENKEQIESLLVNPEWVAAKLEYHNIFGLVADFKLARDLEIPMEEVSKVIFRLFEKKESLRGNLSNNFRSQFRMAYNYSFGSYNEWPNSLRTLIEKSENPEILNFLGITYDIEERNEEAEKVYRKVLKKLNPINIKDYSNALKRLAESLDHQNKLAEALDEFDFHNREMEEATERSNLWLRLSRAKLIQQRKWYQKASLELEDIVENVPEKDTGRKAAALHHLGVIDTELGRLDKAEERFLECLTLRKDKTFDRRRAYEYRGLGQVYALRMKFDEAQKYFLEGLNLSISLGFKRYIRRIGNELISFIHLPKHIKSTKPDFLTVEMLRRKIKEIYKEKLTNKSQVFKDELTDEIIENTIKETFWVLGQWKRKLDVNHDYLPAYMEVIDKTSSSSTDEIVSWAMAHGESNIDKTGRWHKTVAVLLYTDKCQICLQIRGERNSKGKKDVSAGGHIDVRESDREAAIRETYEELGIYIDPYRFERVGEAFQFQKKGSPDIQTKQYPDPFSYQYKSKNINMERFSLFMVKMAKEEEKELQTPANRDAASIEWIPIEDLISSVDNAPQSYASTIKQLAHPIIVKMIKNKCNVEDLE